MSIACFGLPKRLYWGGNENSHRWYEKQCTKSRKVAGKVRKQREFVNKAEPKTSAYSQTKLSTIFNSKLNHSRSYGNSGWTKTASGSESPTLAPSHPPDKICEKDFFIRITSNGLLFVYLNLFCLDLEWTPAEEKRRSSSVGWPAFCFEEWNLS
jgi:hypothetical protein